MTKKATPPAAASAAAPPAPLTHEEWNALRGMFQTSAIPVPMLDGAIALRGKLDAWIAATAPGKPAP